MSKYHKIEKAITKCANSKDRQFNPSSLDKLGGLVLRITPDTNDGELFDDICDDVHDYLTEAVEDCRDIRQHIVMQGTRSQSLWIAVAHDGFVSQEAAEEHIIKILQPKFEHCVLKRALKPFTLDKGFYCPVASQIIPIRPTEAIKHSTSETGLCVRAKVQQVQGIHVKNIDEDLYAEEVAEGEEGTCTTPSDKPVAVSPLFYKGCGYMEGMEGVFFLKVYKKYNNKREYVDVYREFLGKNSPSPSLFSANYLNSSLLSSSTVSSAKGQTPDFLPSTVQAGSFVFVRVGAEEKQSRRVLVVPRHGQSVCLYRFSEYSLPKGVDKNGTCFTEYTYKPINDLHYPPGLTFDPNRMIIYDNKYDHRDLSVTLKYTSEQVNQFRQYLDWVLRVLFGGNEDQFVWYLNAKAMKFQRQGIDALKCGGRAAIFSSKYKGIGKTLFANHIASAINPDGTSADHPLHKVVGKFAFDLARQVVINEDTLKDTSLFEQFKAMVTETHQTRERKYKDTQAVFDETAYDLCTNSLRSIDPDSRRLVIMDTLQGTTDDDPDLRSGARTWADAYGHGAGSGSISTFGINIMRAFLTALQCRKDWLFVHVNGRAYERFCEDKKYAIEGFLHAVDQGDIELPVHGSRGCKVAAIVSPDHESPYRKYTVHHILSPYTFAQQFKKCAVAESPTTWVYAGKNIRIVMTKGRSDTNWVSVEHLRQAEQPQEQIKASKSPLDIQTVWNAVESLYEPHSRHQRTRKFCVKGTPQTSEDFREKDDGGNVLPAEHEEC